jgi:hypothetical protein
MGGGDGLGSGISGGGIHKIHNRYSLAGKLEPAAAHGSIRELHHGLSLLVGEIEDHGGD